MQCLEAALGDCRVRLGVSAIHSELKDFYTGYIESMVAFQASDKKEICCFADMPHTGNTPFARSPFETMQLIHLLRQGSEEALEDVSRAYDAALAGSETHDARLYSEFELVSYYRAILRKVDPDIDTEQFKRLFSLDDPMERKQALCAILREMIAARRAAIAADRKQLERDMIAYVESKYCDSDFGLDRFAERFDISVSTASRLFAELAGENFKKYLVRLRLEQAKFLLRGSNYSIGEIARRSGFSSASYFIQVFKNTQGQTPTAYRAETNGA